MRQSQEHYFRKAKRGDGGGFASKLAIIVFNEIPVHYCLGRLITAEKIRQGKDVDGTKLGTFIAR